MNLNGWLEASWLLLGLLAAGGTATAQPAASLREVQRLAPAEGPPGGLVPFRRGSRWGYADRTGRVIIEPWVSGDPRFFIGGLHVLSSPFAEDSLMVLNGRGEYLRLRRRHWLVADATGALTAVAQATVPPDQPVVRQLPEQFWQSEDDRNRWCYTSPPTHSYVRAGLQFYARPLGADRFLASRPSTATGAPRWATHNALVDGQGRYLTGFRYDELEHFHDGRALVVRAGHLGYLNRQGQEVIAPRYHPPYEVFNAEFCTFRHGVARVFDDSLRSGLIDTTGRVLLPFRHWLALSSPDEAGYCLLRQRTPAGDTVYQYIGPTGQPALGGRTFKQAEPFWHGRAWVKQGGRVGLVDKRGRWVVPCRYDDLYFTNVRHGVETNAPARQHAPGRCFFEAPYERPIYHIDTLVLQAERGGKVGFVDFQTGRELVPPRYDQVIFSSRNGMACVVRQGRAYIIDRRGRELRAAQPFNAFNNGGVARDWQWGAGHRTYLLLSSNSPPNMWLVPDTAWLVTNRRGRTIVPPQPMSRLPLFVTNAGRVAVQTATGCGLLGQGGRVVLAPRYQILAQYGRLLGGFTPEDSTNRLTLFDARGHRLRVLPGVRHVALLTVSGLLYVTQQLPHRRWQTLLLNQAGQVQVVLPGCHNINELPNNVALRQRRYLLQIYPEMDPFTNEEMPGSPACGYMSTNGRRFWEE